MDPVEIIINRLRDPDVVPGVFDVWGDAPWPSRRAVFRSSVPPGYSIDDEPCAVVGPATQTDDIAESFDGAIDTNSVLVRLFADIRTEGDARLSADARAVRNSLHRQRWAVSGGVLVSVRVTGPGPAPTTKPHLGARQMTVRLVG
ncbi:MAG: hypothetical protein AAFY19_00680 [Pseudomonadota bacterium]